VIKVCCKPFLFAKLEKKYLNFLQKATTKPK